MKNFDAWNEKKKKIEQKLVGGKVFCNAREVWWCALGLNVGNEQDGKGEESARPVLVVRVFANNTCVVVPLTTSTKVNPYYVAVGNVDGEESRAIVSQVKTIDKRRLKQKIATLDKSIFSTVLESVKKALFPNG